METQWINKLNKDWNKRKATMTKGQQGSHTQWQYKQQSTDNKQKRKIYRKTKKTTIEWIKKRINNELTKLSKNRNKYKVMTKNGLNGSNTQWQHKQQNIDNRQKSKIHKCLYYIFIHTYTNAALETCQASITELSFWKQLMFLLINIFVKIFIIDVWQGPKYASTISCPQVF